MGSFGSACSGSIGFQEYPLLLGPWNQDVMFLMFKGLKALLGWPLKGSSPLGLFLHKACCTGASKLPTVSLSHNIHIYIMYIYIQVSLYIRMICEHIIPQMYLRKILVSTWADVVQVRRTTFGLRAQVFKRLSHGRYARYAADNTTVSARESAEGSQTSTGLLSRNMYIKPP